MNISTLVVSDVDRFVVMQNFWDRDLEDHIDDPFLFSSLMIEHWKFSQRIGWHPFLMVFLSGKKVVGFAPLLMKSRFGFRFVSNFDQYAVQSSFMRITTKFVSSKWSIFFLGILTVNQLISQLGMNQLTRDY